MKTARPTPAANPVKAAPRRLDARTNVYCRHEPGSDGNGLGSDEIREDGAIRQGLKVLACSIQELDQAIDGLRSDLGLALLDNTPCTDGHADGPLPARCEIGMQIYAKAAEVAALARQVRSLNDRLDL